MAISPFNPGLNDVITVTGNNGQSGLVSIGSLLDTLSATFANPTLTGTVNIDGATASTIFASDASNNLVSLAVATYPSLTELSYVKGLTSAVQTQLGTKAPIDNPTFTTTVTSPSYKLSDASDKNYSLAAYGTGTAYTLTATPAKVTFGTTSPSITIDKAGTYLLEGLANVKLVGATFAASRTVTIKVRRTNNTAADITNTPATMSTAITTTVTAGLGQIATYSVLYTATAGDVIELWGSIDVVPTAGSIQVIEGSLVAMRLY